MREKGATVCVCVWCVWCNIHYVCRTVLLMSVPPYDAGPYQKLTLRAGHSGPPSVLIPC